MFQYISCTIKYDLPTTSIRKIDSCNEILIKEWQIIGPIIPDTSDSSGMTPYMEQDNLVNFGLIEDKLSPTKLLNITSESFFGKIQLSDNFINRRIIVDKDRIDFNKIFKISKEDKLYHAYVACIIQSPKDREVVFLSRSTNGMKIWLNNELIFTVNSGRRGVRYSDFTVGNLNKGYNFLFIKVEKMSKNWWMRANISLVNKTKETFKKRFISNFLDRSIIKKNDSLMVNINLYKTKEPLRLQISDFNENIIIDQKSDFREGYLYHSLSGFTKGLYLCKMFSPSDTFRQRFYYGDIDEQLSEHEQRAKIFKKINKQNKINLDALLIRYKHLLKHKPDYEKRGRENLKVNPVPKKIVHVAYELETVLSNLEKGQEAFRNCSGTHLRGYRSKIDGQIQHYMIHVPEKCTKVEKSMPLLIRFPTDADIPRPFLESTHVANTIKLEKFIRLADKYGIAVLWPSARSYTNININPVGTTDIFEILGEVKKDYSIDEDRIYLYASCGGCRMIFLLAARFPTLFAAIGFRGTILDFPSTSKLIVSTAGKKWVKANSPLDYIENLFHIPVYIIHHKDDRTAPLKYSFKLIEKSKNIGNQIEFELLENVYPDLYPEESYDNIFKFYKDNVRIKSPNTIRFSTAQMKYNTAYWIKIKKLISMKKASIEASISSENIIDVKTRNILQYEIVLDKLNYEKGKPVTVKTNGLISFQDFPKENSIVVNIEDMDESKKDTQYKNHEIEGPVLDAFGNSFIVVEGTIGSKKNLENLKQQVNEFRTAWKEEYWGDCRHRKDKEIKEEDIKNNHLILFGNQYSNLMIKKVINQIPLKIEKNRLIVHGKKYYGDKLGIHLIYPNPLNPDKYVVILGSNNLEHFRLGEKLLSLNGWFDYSVWSYENSQIPKIIDAGYFDFAWQ
jgi:predicted peptidase